MTFDNLLVHPKRRELVASLFCLTSSLSFDFLASVDWTVRILPLEIAGTMDSPGFSWASLHGCCSTEVWRTEVEMRTTQKTYYLQKLVQGIEELLAIWHEHWTRWTFSSSRSHSPPSQRPAWRVGESFETRRGCWCPPSLSSQRLSLCKTTIINNNVYNEFNN